MFPFYSAFIQPLKWLVFPQLIINKITKEKEYFFFYQFIARSIETTNFLHIITSRPNEIKFLFSADWYYSVKRYSDITKVIYWLIFCKP